MLIIGILLTGIIITAAPIALEIVGDIKHQRIVAAIMRQKREA